ncbi:hypothetical protein K2X05_00145 [bacterium]|nr:hypothetical protein [bacterium]
MQSRKNILFLALLLNCIYFLGISFFVHRQLSNRTEQLQGITWLNNAAQQVLKSLLLIPPEPPPAGTVVRPEEIPFPKEHFNETTIGFHKKDEQFIFTYLSDNKFISEKKPIKPVLEQLTVFGVDLSIVEKEQDDRRVLFSSFTNETAQDLLNQTPFEQLEIESSKWTINKEKYLIKMINLSDDPKLQQKMVFSLKLPNYEAISVSEILIYIWTFFCISIVFLFFVFKKYELSD